MRKVLIIVIILLLVALGYTMSFNGLEIGKFQIWSVKELSESSKSIDTKIEEINSLIDVQYPKKISDLKSASNNMKTAKEEYLNYTNLSSDEQILRAMQEESYSIEFLWTKIGNHATSEGVNLKFEIVSSSTGGNNVNDINFTVQGTYIGITNFIYAIENDQDLNFRIQNFKLVPDQGNILKGTFIVKNIAIQGNTSGQQSTTTGTSGTTEANNSNSASNANTTTKNSDVKENANTIQNTEASTQAVNAINNTTSTAQ